MYPPGDDPITAGDDTSASPGAGSRLVLTQKPLEPSAGDTPPAPSLLNRLSLRGILFVLAATFAWSTTGIFIDQLERVYRLDPLEISTWRSLLVTLGLTGYMLAFRRQDFRLARKDFPYFIFYGLIGIALFNLIWSRSVEVNQPAVATALIFSAPVFVAVGVRFLWGEPINTSQSLAIAINLVGCALVMGLNDPAAVTANPTGMALGLASGVCFGASTLFGKGVERRGRFSLATVLFYIFLVATVALLTISIGLKGGRAFTLGLDGRGWLLLAGLSLGPTLVGYAFFTLSLRYLPAPVTSLFGTLEPPVTAVLALFLLGQSMSPLQWSGTFLIIAGVCIMQLAALPARAGAK